MSHLYFDRQQPSVTAVTSAKLTVTASLITSNEAFEGSQSSQILVWTACCVGQYNADKLLHNNNKYREESTKFQCEQQQNDNRFKTLHSLPAFTTIKPHYSKVFLQTVAGGRSKICTAMMSRISSFECTYCLHLWGSESLPSSNALWTLYMKMVKWIEGSLISDIWKNVVPSKHVKSITLPLSITTQKIWILKMQMTKCILLEVCFNVQIKYSIPRFSWQSKRLHSNISAQNHTW
jgi:hypothetical protein